MGLLAHFARVAELEAGDAIFIPSKCGGIMVEGFK